MCESWLTDCILLICHVIMRIRERCPPPLTCHLWWVREHSLEKLDPRQHLSNIIQPNLLAEVGVNESQSSKHERAVLITHLSCDKMDRGVMLSPPPLAHHHLRQMGELTPKSQTEDLFLTPTTCNTQNFRHCPFPWQMQ